MKVNQEKGIRSEKGFTMIELIIVIAIIGILSAILVPSFTTMSRKSKLRADISTIKQVQTQIDLYMAEHDGKYPSASTVGLLADPITIDGAAPATTGTVKLPTQTVLILARGEYIKASDVVGDVELADTAGQTIKVQSKDGLIYYDAASEHIILSLKAGTKEFNIAGQVGDSDKAWVAKIGH